MELTYMDPHDVGGLPHRSVSFSFWFDLAKKIWWYGYKEWVFGRGSRCSSWASKKRWQCRWWPLILSPWNRKPDPGTYYYFYVNYINIYFWSRDIRIIIFMWIVSILCSVYGVIFVWWIARWVILDLFNYKKICFLYLQFVVGMNITYRWIWKD